MTFTSLLLLSFIYIVTIEIRKYDIYGNIFEKIVGL